MNTNIHVMRYEEITIEKACYLLDNCKEGYLDADSRCLVIINKDINF